MNIKSVLVDRRNYHEIKYQIISEIQSCEMIGLDTETHNLNAHEGIKSFRKNDDMRATDYRRITIVGLSIYPYKQSETRSAYYFNLNHADVENRLTWKEVKTLLDAKPETMPWIAHNAVYELTVLKSAYDFDVDPYYCTLQLAVSAWGPDEYDPDQYLQARFSNMQDIFMEAELAFKNYERRSQDRDDLTPAQSDLVAKVLTKSSFSGASYNGLIQSLSYGYGLKALVKRFLNYTMNTFDETLGDSDTMGDLTGDETFIYGAEDAYCAVMLFCKIIEYMSQNCPTAIPAFINQENPMVKVFSDIRLEGLKVNSEAIENRKNLERKNFAEVLRKLKAQIRELLPFPATPNERLMKYEKWYQNKHDFYRKRLVAWATSPDSDDDYEQVCQVSSPVSNAWAGHKLEALSITHYFQARILLYDLTGMDAVLYKGKVQSDSETRGVVRDKIKLRLKQYIQDDNKKMIHQLQAADELVRLMGELASIEQRMKLYLTPYQLLTDPETQRMYPEVSSMLATRRMACSNPNAQQLAKRGESVYVRGFYIPDEDDHVLVSLDWSQIELVLIGEFSGDKKFAEAYGQLPYKDLHVGATVAGLKVTIPDVTVDMFKSMARMADTEASTLPEKILVNIKGETMTPSKAYKYWRTELGKKMNFGYWYSGALSDTAEAMGWSTDQMWKAVEAYRSEFPDAERWRVKTIEEAHETGCVMLPDGLRRVRYEATDAWLHYTHAIFCEYRDNGNMGIYNFGNIMMRSIRSRAGNQIVNALIQGSCATLAKRSIIKIMPEGKKQGLRFKFKMPIHDELLFSVHRDDVIDFIKLVKTIMNDHPDIIKKLKVDCTASVGLTFEPFNKETVPLGQIELDEAPEILGFTGGSKLNEQEITKVIDYLFEKRKEIQNG